MFEEFLNLITETWQVGIRGIGLSDLIACLAIIIGSLVARTLLNTVVIDRIAKLADNTESEFDDEIVESLRTPFGVIPIAFGFYLITAYLPLTGSLDLIATNLVKMIVIYTIFSALANITRPLFSLLGDSTWMTPAMSTWLTRVSGVMIWIVGITMMLDVWGIEIGPIIAGLGLFSVAVALGAVFFLVAGIICTLYIGCVEASLPRLTEQ